MQEYYIFGTDWVGAYSEHENIDDLIDALNENDALFGCSYVYNSSDSGEALLLAYDGWDRFWKITHDEYEKLVNANIISFRT